VLYENNVNKRGSEGPSNGLEKFQRDKEALSGPGLGPSGPSKRTVLDDDSSSDDSSDDDIARTVPYRTPAFTQGIGRLFRCLCNPAYDVDDDFEPPK